VTYSFVVQRISIQLVGEWGSGGVGEWGSGGVGEWGSGKKE